MNNKKILLFAVNLIAISGGLFAFKVHHKFGGRYLCASTYRGTWFITRYTTTVPPFGTTLYCTTTSTAPKTTTYRVTINL